MRWTFSKGEIVSGFPNEFQQNFNRLIKEIEDIKKERDPNGFDLKQPGAKADAKKAPVLQGALQYFPRAIMEISRVSEIGANKYSWKGWEKVPDGPNRFGNALARHILYEAIEGEFDRDTGCLHAAQEAWNALARLELILREKEK